MKETTTQSKDFVDYLNIKIKTTYELKRQARYTYRKAGLLGLTNVCVICFY
jgi:hypothetical protein